MRQESEHAQPIVNDYDYKTFFRQIFAIENWHGRGAFVKSTSMNENENRQPLSGGICGCPDIQIQAIFADFVMRHELVGEGLALPDDRLDATGAVAIGDPDALPGRDRLGRPPPEI